MYIFSSRQCIFGPKDYRLFSLGNKDVSSVVGLGSVSTRQTGQPQGGKTERSSREVWTRVTGRDTGTVAPTLEVKRSTSPVVGSVVEGEEKRESGGVE